jgi:hypothetical protein
VTVNRVPQNPYESNAPFVVYSDPLIDPDAKPLPAGEERVVMAMSDRPLPRYTGKLRFVPFVTATHNLEEPVAAAGILDNGATTVDAALLRTLVVRRSNMLQAIEIALETLSDVGQHNVPREQLIARFKKMAVSARRWYIPPEQRVAGLVYQSILAKLTDLPVEEVGSPFPPTTFIAEETAMLNQRRVAILESQPRLADAFPVD